MYYNNFFVVFTYSDHGAQQISADFAFLRTWIANNETLKEESRRYLLLLDSIRQCEGVAKILQSKAGSELDIKPAKNKVVPIGGNDNSEFYILNIGYFAKVKMFKNLKNLKKTI